MDERRVPPERGGLRAAQGLFGALLQPATLALLRLVYPPDRIGGPVAVRTAAIWVAAAAGPLLGGVLVERFGWRAVFVANVPVALAIAAAALFLRAPAPPPAEPGRIRPGGAVLLAAALAALVHALAGVPEHGWPGPGPWPGSPPRPRWRPCSYGPSAAPPSPDAPAGHPGVLGGLKQTAMNVGPALGIAVAAGTGASVAALTALAAVGLLPASRLPPSRLPTPRLPASRLPPSRQLGGSPAGHAGAGHLVGEGAGGRGEGGPAPDGPADGERRQGGDRYQAQRSV